MPIESPQHVEFDLWTWSRPRSAPGVGRDTLLKNINSFLPKQFWAAKPQHLQYLQYRNRTSVGISESLSAESATPEVMRHEGNGICSHT